MGIFDLFSSSGADKAINSGLRAQVAGIQNGLVTANGALMGGMDALRSGYGQAGQTYQGLINAYQPGAAAYGNALGLGGAAGTQSALASLQATPGYQFSLNQGTQNAMRQNAASGQLASGKTDVDLANYASGLADQTYKTYLSGLQPYLSGFGGAAQGLASAQTGLGQGINTDYGNLASLYYNANTGVGNAQANADTAKAAASQAAGNNLLSLFGGAAKLATGLGF